MNNKIGFIGTGIMGTGMCRNLLKAGFSVYAWNRSTDKLADLKSEGVHVCSTPSELAGAVDVIMTCLSNYTVLQAVLFGDQGIQTGTIKAHLAIGLETIAPAEALNLSEQLATYGINFIDAPVSGGDKGAKEGTLTVMAGGSTENIEQALPILQAIGKRIFHTGGPGSGQATKAVNQIAVGITVGAMTEAILLAQSLELDVQQTVEILATGAAGSWSLDHYAPRLLAGDLRPGFKAQDMLKDLRIALQEAQQRNLQLPLASAIQGLYSQLCEQGGGELGNHALVQSYTAGRS